MPVDYQELKEFITKRMRMSHVYQPVMIKALLEAGGPLSAREIGRCLLNHDESQLEYYEAATDGMVGRVLRRHGVVAKSKAGYVLRLDGVLTEERKREIIELCEQRVEEYVKKRGAAIWAHRRSNREPVPGSVRYEVLKRAKGRCEACGRTTDERAIQVDHIKPRNRGGGNEIGNLQALCYVCNAAKRDSDDTNFGEWKEKPVGEYGCPFCVIDEGRLIERDGSGFVYAMWDLYPVTEGHALVIPVRHVGSFFELPMAEQRACLVMVERVRGVLRGRDGRIEGFNVGINEGQVAGQTVGHCHVHVIPRRKGDVEDPRGGVRHVMPGKGFY